MPGLRDETLRRILRVDAALDRVTALREALLREGQRLARRDAQLRVHQIDAGHAFGDRMLDLQARVHLEEIEARVVAVAFEQELARAGVAIADRLGGGDGRRAHPLANRRRSSAGHGLSSITF